ncbi:UPF0111 protein like [Actinidia chinensis var. chinensis]|uniref:UPF0111 protein like n=1 Tax=Actinidia chinensis var. chinensis TaxID=1590841 RepID=A0A2R6PXQ5_ACTCC|nr:UPF0111 protein like [Actinidia chinensis var. chinensis]
MMAHKHLHELLQEDQEPFLLKNYIADRRSQLNRPNKPIVQKSISKHSIYKKACFFSLQDSPDVWKSPVLNFPATAPGKSPRKSPIKSANGVLLHIPARTASLLLDAAMRVHKQPSYAKHRKTHKKNVGIGLLGSIIKRLSEKKPGQKGEIEGKSEEKSEKLEENFVALDEKSCMNSRRCSAVWSESNVDLESSSSSRSEESEEIDEYGDEERENMDFDFCEKRFCSSPLSPFRFALQTSPSPGRRTPVFSSPATSPIRHKKQEEETCETESIQQIHLVEEEEEEKEQFSPVSVFDPPFEEDGDGDGDGNEDGDGNGGDDYDDIECSYAIVQKAKHQLLQNIRQFEKLAELDPIELEKRMLEEQDENDDLDDEEEREQTESRSLCREGTIEGYVREVHNRLGLHLDKLPEDMTRLVLDLISEEKRDNDDIDTVAKRVCERLDSWKEVKSNTIDMMVGLNFRGEIDGWKRSDKEQVDKTAVDIEFAILGLLLEELSGEMVYC